MVAGDTRDGDGRGKFFNFVPEDYLVPGRVPGWYMRYKFYPSELV